MSLSQSKQDRAQRQFKCPVHTYVFFSRGVCKIIDSPHFQRLRKVKQLGTTSYVWPSASHDRFAHWVGHLAGQLVCQLRKNQPELELEDEDVELLKIAGLCHDLGHGPWSHVFDGMFMPKAAKPRPDGTTWQHEEGSEMMFDDLIASNNIEMSDKDREFVKALIAGDPSRVPWLPKKKLFLFDIVANKRNGLDVDKFDYIVRDSHMVGHKVNLDILRLVGSARVIDNQICYDCKDVNNVYKIGENRFELHKMVYHHKSAKAIEYMIIDALLLADPFMGIADAVNKPKSYLNLTDSVMDRIQASEDPCLEPAQEIFTRIAKRDLYRLVDFRSFPWNKEHKEYVGKHVTPDTIFKNVQILFGGSSPQYNPPTDVVISKMVQDDIIVDLSCMHYGMKEINPLKKVRFYNKANPNVSFPAKDGDYSTLRPAVFAEYKLQIYCKQSKYKAVIQKAYRVLCEDDWQLQTILMTEEPADTEDEDGLDDGEDVDATRAASLAPTEPETTTPPPSRRPRTFSKVRSHNPSMTCVDGISPSGRTEASFDEEFSSFKPKRLMEDSDSPTPASKKLKVDDK